MRTYAIIALVAACVTVATVGADEDPELRGRHEKIKAALCSGPHASDKIERFFECDTSLTSIVVRLSARAFLPVMQLLFAVSSPADLRQRRCCTSVTSRL